VDTRSWRRWTWGVATPSRCTSRSPWCPDDNAKDVHTNRLPSIPLPADRPRMLAWWYSPSAWARTWTPRRCAAWPRGRSNSTRRQMPRRWRGSTAALRWRSRARWRGSGGEGRDVSFRLRAPLHPECTAVPARQRIRREATVLSSISLTFWSETSEAATSTSSSRVSATALPVLTMACGSRICYARR
jgi:hypothetical protein